MRRRSRAGEPGNIRRRKTVKTVERQNASKSARHSISSAAGPETEVTRLARERDEALEQQAATAEVLKALSHSTFDLQSVLESLLEKAVRLCDAEKGLIYRQDGDVYRVAASYGHSDEFLEKVVKPNPIGTDRSSATGRVVVERRVVHIHDILADPEYHWGKDQRDHEGMHRTILAVPMLKGDAIIGVIVIRRTQVLPFTDKQIELVKNFAAQAVIAIENTRLLSELRQRTTDLTESLEQQTATAEVLRVISSSPGDLTPVFNAMLENATKLCGAEFGLFYLDDGDLTRIAAAYNVPPALAATQNVPYRVHPKSGLAELRRTKQVVAIDDIRVMPPYLEGDPRLIAMADLGGARSTVGVPMLKDNDLVGAIAIYRQEVLPFTDKQIELLQNFAAQAVIAIENARLLNELRQRTVDLTESLEQQTATSDVFQLISSPQAPVQAVLDSVAANAVRLCEALHATIYLRDGEFVVIRAHSGPLGRTPIGTRQVPHNKWVTGRVVLEGRTIHVPDLQSDDDYPEGKEIALRLGHRTTLGVPLISNETAIGAILLRRREVRPFNDRQIALVQNFAAQAVIAIENARLLKELHERTEKVVKLNQQLEQRVADQVGEIERMSRLRRFLPPQVADLIVASGTEKQLESHRLEITALFCDLRGFTGFSESSDPEDVMALLRDYHAAIGEIIVKYSGTLERFAGDGVMVIFNDPVPVENPALQAVLMALDMRTAIGEMIEKWRDLGHDLGFGIGIAHGFATLGTIGFEGRFDYAAIGTVSNVASRLCDEAKPGQILISPRVRQAVDKAVTVEAVGEFTLKGIRRPMTAYNVLAALPSKPN